MTQSLSLRSNGAAICCLSRLRQPTDGELIGVAECSCAGCRTVRALNQKVSLLLIIHNATNSRHLSFPPASFNILAATQRGRKKGGKENNLHTIITVGRADVCLDDNISRGGGGFMTQKTTASMRREWRRAGSGEASEKPRACERALTFTSRDQTKV